MRYLKANFMFLKKHIAILTPWFPPKIGVAVSRMEAFAKYLDKEKFVVSVITAGEEDRVEKKDGLTVYYVKEYYKWFKIPSFDKPVARWKHYLKVIKKVLILFLVRDEGFFWRRRAYRCLVQLHQQLSVDVVISSYPPLSPHYVAMQFKKDNPATRWIADMRDEMSQNRFLPLATRKQYAAVEKEINGVADAITSVSEPIVNQFRYIMPDVPHVVEIRNGFDHDLWDDDTYSFNEIFTILYAGTFYAKIKPDTLLQAVRQLIYQYRVRRVSIVFLGTSKNFDIPSDLLPYVVFKEKVPYKQAILEMKKADLNVFIHPVTEAKGIYSGKLFDYISVRKPILVVGDKEDVAARLVTQYQLGYVASFGDVNEITERLWEAYQNWEQRIPFQTNKQVIQYFHRKYQVKKLEELIIKLTTK